MMVQTDSPLSSRASKETELWKTWVTGGKRPEHLRPLLKSMEPLVQQAVNKYRAADIAPHALRTQAENQLIQGLHSYKPTKGSLSTHLTWQMRGVGRFVEKHQNFARIPGSRIRFIGRLQSTQSELEDELGRAPTLSELAKRSKISQKQIGKLQKEMRGVHIMGMSVDDEGAPLAGDTADFTLNADRERLELIYHDLTPVEQQVVDYSLGRGGKPRVKSNNEIARRMGVSPARISNVRASITQKLKGLSWIR